MKTRQPKPIVTPKPPPALSSQTSVAIICLALTITTLLVYFQTFHYDFVNYDDNGYVYQNPMLKPGLSAKGISWAFTTFHQTNWHPLTWISYLLDYQLFGLNAGAEHAVNVLFHIGATLLLFFALLRMTQQPWRCAFVAGIFALHPLHVESVAWIAERKDVLSTFFAMLTLLLYARYAAKPSPQRYSLITLAFLLSLLSKPMAVTLPFVLLLLDAWPVRRLDLKTWKRPVLEKLPLLAMSAAASTLTYLAQRSVVSVGVPFSERFANAAIAYLSYLGKAVWPVDLAVMYPLTTPSSTTAFWALLLLIAITAGGLVTFRKRPYFLIGWLWYLGMLVPVIGLVQVGRQAMADRYTYMPLVGISIALVWAISEAVEASPALRQTAAVLGGLLLLAMAAGAYRQTEYWNNSETLFRHTIAVTYDNPIAFNLGVILQGEGRIEEAAALYRQSIGADPKDAPALTNLGVILVGQGKREEAIALFQRAIAADPKYAEAHANLGHERLRSGQIPEAFTELSEAVRLKPEAPEIQEDMGVILAAGGHFDEARQHLEESVRLKPASAQAQNDLCFVLQHLNRLDNAIAACEAALKINPASPDARFNLGTALAAAGKSEAAAQAFKSVLKSNPTYAPAQAALDKLK